MFGLGKEVLTSMEFRLLRADEIEVRVGTCSKDGCSLLLYKDARCDMSLLDETVGPMNWQRHHSRDNANCIVSIWDQDKLQWIEKEDTGTESNQQKEKGLASDSFKRACFNWGIGTELYTAPRIWIGANDAKIVENSGRFSTYDKFSVEKICYENREIVAISIVNTSKTTPKSPQGIRVKVWQKNPNMKKEENKNV